ncbi:flagellar protein FliT [Castellaniella ginsengisoli]
MSHLTLLERYQEIADLSGQMLNKAQTQEWDELVALGTRYQAAVERLKTLDPLDDDQKNARRELLTRILDDDARIRQLISPELERLSHLLGTFKRQRTVLQAYYSTVRPH